MSEVHPDLQRERDGSKLNVSVLTHVLDGSAEKTARRRFLQNVVATDKSGWFENGEDGIYMHRKERHVRALGKFVRAVEIAREMNMGSETEGELTIDPDFMMLLEAIADDFPTMLHWVMFVPNIRSLADDEQRAEWLPLCRDWKMIGCYAQTELGHGSNVRALETTATFQKNSSGDDGVWVIHSPTLTAAKFWPGTLGRTANHAMVIARLIDGKGIDRGMHNFLVPLRDYQTHKLLKGVTTGDIGPKIGYNNMDNGFASFDNVIISRRNMAMRFATVDTDGKYSKKPMSPAASKISYITMMQVRAIITLDTGRLLAMACTISIRYSTLRRQGFQSSSTKKEVPILNYRQQQHRLLPLLAASYVIYFSGIQVKQHLSNLEYQLIHNAESTDVTKTQVSDLHATTSALKAFSSTLSTDGIEDCRKACGGHGFLASSGLPELYTYSLQHPTVEGDNHMLPQQVARVLLKLVHAITTNDLPLIQEWKKCDAAYLIEPIQTILRNGKQQQKSPLIADNQSWTNNNSNIRKAHEYRTATLLCQLSQQIHHNVTKNGQSQATAWNNALIQMARVNKSHAICLLLHKFESAIPQMDNMGVQEIKAMNTMYQLFGLYWMEKDMGDFVLYNIISARSNNIRSTVLQLLDEVRPDAVILVDAWDFPDSRLKSTLGRYDGQVYPAIMKAAKKDPLNATEPGPGYDPHLKRLIVDGVGTYSPTASRL